MYVEFCQDRCLRIRLLFGLHEWILPSLFSKQANSSSTDMSGKKLVMSEIHGEFQGPVPVSAQFERFWFSFCFPPFENMRISGLEPLIWQPKWSSLLQPRSRICQQSIDLPMSCV